MSFITLKVTIKSDHFDRFFAIDGKGMLAFTMAGAGSVTSSPALGPLSILYMDKYDNGTISIRAPNNPGVFLRLDANDENKQTWGGNGFGTVNCQYFRENLPHPDGKEILRLRAHPDGSSSLESVEDPGVFLRMDKLGTMNCQWYGAGRQGNRSWQLFTVILLD
ncbi:hypothetical protein DL95DRAFT_459184 [Leptodontidium sp. 2 PMI_412]|nr:hypothetical protein DL95DRAFT_459184 [Leptodontidium sp. 2 PMI_412]